MEGVIVSFLNYTKQHLTRRPMQCALSWKLGSTVRVRGGGESSSSSRSARRPLGSLFSRSCRPPCAMLLFSIYVI